MLAIEKKGKSYQYQYIFDAKYRIDFAEKLIIKGSMAPLVQWKKTLIQCTARDALVVEQEGPFERTAYGAYVLFLVKVNISVKF